MISADLHMHTCFSHGANTPAEMLKAAKGKGLKLIGFSEHSPRPEGYDYTHEYRQHLSATFPDYIAQVKGLKRESHEPEVLLGLEMDWLPQERDFVRQSIGAYDYDYLIGSVHFLDHWGFDDTKEAWLEASQEECENRYLRYFEAWHSMLASGWFQIAAHPDLIKIYSVSQFHIWLDKPESRNLIKGCLVTLRDSGMAMEISSAGLRKACREIYPGPQIMELAREAGVQISFASDAHNTADVGSDFDFLGDYAKRFGFTRHTVFTRNSRRELDF